MATTERSKRPWEDVPRRGLLAHLEYLRTASEVFTEAIDTYVSDHNASQDRWLRDFPKNASRASEEVIKGLFRAQRRAIDKYFEEEDGNAASED